LSQQPAEQPRLTPREQRVLELMSGLADGRRYSIPELARRFGTSEDQIIQILQSAKRKELGLGLVGEHPRPGRPSTAALVTTTGVPEPGRRAGKEPSR
jgi:DNA-binding CsgD family transcriptional regulator